MQHRLILGILLTIVSLTISCTPTGTGTKSAEELAPSYTDAMPLYQGIQSLTDKLVASSGQQLTGKIAVADFAGPGSEIYAFGDHISNKLSVRMFSSGAFPEFMERKQLKQVLGEMQKEHGYIFDQSTVKQFGKMLGLDNMVIGTIEDVGSVVDITVKIIASETGRLLAMADVQIIKDANIAKLLNQQRTATLIISVSPAVSGTVVANGQQVSLRNGIAAISGIPYGEQPVIIQPNEYDSVRRNITIRSSSETFAISLESKHYDVSFQIIPPEATLTVDGNRIELNPQGFAKVTSLENREYSYVVGAKGHQEQIDTFNPANNQLITINLNTSDPFLKTKNKFTKKVQELDKKQDFEIQIWTDKTNYRVREPINFYFKAERDCYISLVDINSKGEITQLFPNQFDRNNRIQGGRTYHIPGDTYGFQLKAQPPVGTDRIYAIASTQPINIFSNDFNNQSFISVTRGNTRGIGVIGANLDTANLSAATSHVITIH